MKSSQNYSVRRSAINQLEITDSRGVVRLLTSKKEIRGWHRLRFEEDLLQYGLRFAATGFGVIRLKKK